MKNLLAFVITCVFTLLLAGCQKEQLTHIQQQKDGKPTAMMSVNMITGAMEKVMIASDPVRADQKATARASVSANGHYNIFSLSRDAIAFTLTFSTMQNNGGTHGNARMNAKLDGLVDFSFDVNCITTIGNRATIGGTITHVYNDGGNPFFFAVGNDVYMAVEDNGKGPNAPRDKFSPLLMITLHESVVDCAQYPPDSPLWEFFGPWREVYLPSDLIEVNN